MRAEGERPTGDGDGRDDRAAGVLRLRPAAGHAVSITLIALAVPVACDRPVHPNDPGIPDAVCEPRCEREHACDPTIDVPGCVGNCEHRLSPRVIYHREDVVASERSCALGQTCIADVDRAISTCQADVWRRLEPSALDRAYCKRRVDRAFKCGDYRWNEDHCVFGTKGYTDAIIGQLDGCLDQPCPRYQRCELAVVGDDPFWSDEDRVAEFHRNPVPQAGPATVMLRGRVATEGAGVVPGPVPDAEVCLADRRSCTRADASGAFALAVAAHAEVAIAVVAPTFGPRLVGVATTGHDIGGVGVDLLPDDGVRDRYVAMGATYPDASRGFIYATASAPEGSRTGLAGVTMAIAPSSGVGPSFFSPGGEVEPARTETSTFSSGLFAAVTPGAVTLTMGPSSIQCVPRYGGWPAGPNAVRVPVAAGFETRVSMRCHASDHQGP
jgi:hypothetical protein